MTFEEELHRTIDTLGDRIRHEAAGHFQTAMLNFRRAIDLEREDALKLEREKVEQAADARVRELSRLYEETKTRLSEAEFRAHEAETRLQTIERRADAAEARLAETPVDTADAQAGTGSGARATANDQSAVGLANGIRAIDAAPSLSALLDALVMAVRNESQSAAIFIVRAGELRTWRLLGFGDALDQSPAFDVPMADAGILARALEQRAPVSSSSANHQDIPGFAAPIDSKRRLMTAVPVSVGGTVSALVYADIDADSPEVTGSPDRWAATLDVLCRYAGRVLEAITVLRSAQRIEPSPNPDASSTAPTATGPEDEGPLNVIEVVTRVHTADDEDGAQDVGMARRFARLLRRS